MAAQALVLGYFGAKNWGDDLILESFLRAYREVLEPAGIALTVTVKQPPSRAYQEELRALFPHISFTPVSPLLPTALRFSKHRFLFCPGGSLLQNATSNRSLLYYLSVISRFTVRGRRAFMLNQGIGPITGQRYLEATRRVLARIALFTARDQDTLAWVRENAPECRTQLASDGVFACDQPFTVREAVRPKKALVFALREGIAEEAMEFTISSVPRTHSVFLAALQAADLHYLRELRTRTVFPHERVEVLGAAEFARRLPGCALCVSERYHGLIAAMLARVPYVGIGDDPKIISFCKETGMPYFVRDALHEATAEDLLARAQAAYNQERLDAVAAAYRQRQQQQRELVASLIRELEPSATTAD